MSVNDPIADMLTRIRNAASARLETVEMPHSRMKGEIARVLKENGFIQDFKTDKQQGRPELQITLRYARGRQPLIRGLRRVSKPGLRRYTAAADAPRVVGGMGMAIISTSKGLMTDREARKARLGGEVVCFIW
jgi:small subunit ribosomal protein S8